MPLKIYGIPRTRTARTLWMAHELGIPYELVRTAPPDGDTRKPAFLAINPNGQVPTIDDDGLVLWESLAINLYLAKRHGGPLAPRDLREDAQMTMWTVWAGTTFEPDAHEVVVHTINLPPEKRDATKLASSIEKLQAPLRALETSLSAGGGHLVGNRFTVADLNVACVAFYLRAAPQALAGFPAVAAWYRAATDRAAFKTMIALREKG
ncbi:MAG: glutathione S-transferase family protein [Alphaproteobacteria bacterium]|nr:glutathione S-transferase family protein [Alphaproteobacteria bacterium]